MSVHANLPSQVMCHIVTSLLNLTVNTRPARIVKLLLNTVNHTAEGPSSIKYSKNSNKSQNLYVYSAEMMLRFTRFSKLFFIYIAIGLLVTARLFHTFKINKINHRISYRDNMESHSCRNRFMYLTTCLICGLRPVKNYGHVETVC